MDDLRSGGLQPRSRKTAGRVAAPASRKERREKEASIERRADRWAKEHGLKFRKMNGAGQRSWPDKLYLLPNGVAAFVEFKKRGERPTKLQAQMLADLTALRQHARWFDSSDDAIAWLSQLLQLRRKFGKAVTAR